MEKQEFEIKITILDLWRIFASKFFIILLGALLVGGGTFAYSYYTYEPVYQSNSKIYILPQFSDSEQSAGSFQQTLNAAQNVVNDCKLIIQSEGTKQKVIDELDLNCPTSALTSKITVSISEDSRIITISAKDTNQEHAQKLANTLANCGIERINTITGVNQASLMDYGKLPSSPINSIFSLKIFAFGVATAILIYAVYVIIFLCNDRIVNPEDASNYLSLTVLGIIPNEDEIQSNKKYKGYGNYKYKKYGKYSKTYEYKNKEYKAEQAENKKEVK